MTKISRRGAIIGLAAWGVGARVRAGDAQPVYRVAVLVHGTERMQGNRVEALRAGLKAHGYTEGRNLNLSVRWNEGGLDLLPDVAGELVRENPDVFVCAPVLAAAAVHKHTRTVPIVLAYGAGLVKIGLAKSFAHPGGNVTGFETRSEDLLQKHMELIKTIAPGISRLGVLNTGRYLFHEEAWRAATEAARALKLALIDVRVSGPSDLARLTTACDKGGCNALYVMPDPSLLNWRGPIIERVARLRLPAVYFQPEFAQEGGLMSYSANAEDMFRRAAGYVDRILKGARPASLPIEQPSKFELIVNLRTARTLGLTIPSSVLLRATQVIE